LRCIVIAESNDDIEQNNIQGSLLLEHFANSLRNYNFFTSMLGHQGARPADYRSGGRCSNLFKMFREWHRRLSFGWLQFSFWSTNSNHKLGKKSFIGWRFAALCKNRKVNSRVANFQAIFTGWRSSASFGGTYDPVDLSTRLRPLSLSIPEAKARAMVGAPTSDKVVNLTVRQAMERYTEYKPGVVALPALIAEMHLTGHQGLPVWLPPAFQLVAGGFAIKLCVLYCTCHGGAPKPKMDQRSRCACPFAAVCDSLQVAMNQGFFKRRRFLPITGGALSRR
jgi:hypothetical protein